MREIKFRGRRVDGEGWVYGHYYTTKYAEKNDGVRHMISWGDHWGNHEVFPETISQFTTKKDKNGKYIYEGDLVKAYRANSDLGHQNDLYKIYWDELHCAFNYWIFSSDNPNRVDQPLYTCNKKPFLLNNPNIEVIANIYEQL